VPHLGNHVAMVNSTCIVEGEDDLFGEDDHMAHHYSTTVYFKVECCVLCRYLPCLSYGKVRLTCCCV
jgi:hypothetical protein